MVEKITSLALILSMTFALAVPGGFPPEPANWGGPGSTDEDIRPAARLTSLDLTGEIMLGVLQRWSSDVAPSPLPAGRSRHWPENGPATTYKRLAPGKTPGGDVQSLPAMLLKIRSNQPPSILCGVSLQI